MFRTFDDIEKYVLENGIVKKIALCGAHDEPALSAVVDAVRKGVASAVLIGDEKGIKAILDDMGETADAYEIINMPEETDSAAQAIKMVKAGEADIPMKGLMQTATYMRAILNKETGILPAGRTLSECTPFEYKDGNRFMFVTDCAVNITPDLEGKVKIINNAVELAEKFGIEDIKVAALSAVEKVNEKIPSSVDAAKLAEMEWDNCTVEGPFALDNAVSEEAAAHKGIGGKVAGKADILLASDLGMGNVIHKGLNYFAHTRTAGALCGTEHPVILTSRTDTADSKYNSILVAILQSL